MEKLKDTHDVTITWHSFELRPPGSPPIPPEYRARIEAARPQMVAIAQEHYGIDMSPGTVSTTSRAALAGGKYAEAHGVGEAYHRAVMHAYWQESGDIGDDQLLADIAVSIGLDRQEFLDALHDQQWQAQVKQDVSQAHAYGLTGVPALILEGKYLVSGAQPYPVLRQIVEQIQAQRQDA